MREVNVAIADDNERILDMLGEIIAAVFLGMESGWRTNASFDFIEPSARPQFHRNGV